MCEACQVCSQNEKMRATKKDVSHHTSKSRQKNSLFLRIFYATPMSIGVCAAGGRVPSASCVTVLSSAAATLSRIVTTLELSKGA